MGENQLSPMYIFIRRHFVCNLVPVPANNLFLRYSSNCVTSPFIVVESGGRQVKIIAQKNQRRYKGQRCSSCTVLVSLMCLILHPHKIQVRGWRVTRRILFSVQER